MTDPTKDPIFLSYARADDDPDYHDPEKSFMRRLYDALKDDYAVWWDRESMPSGGRTFTQEIKDAIAKSQRVVLVVGKGITTSKYVRMEWEFALSLCKAIVPIIRNGDYNLRPNALPETHVIDFREDDTFDASVAELKRILSEPESPLGELFGVPTLPDDYIEREILGSVRETLLDSNAPVVVTSAKEQSVTVHGVGGIGKTTLSIALGRSCEVRRSFPNGVFFLEMGKTPDILQRMASLGALLGDAREAYTDETTARQRLSAMLAGKQALLILDDIWDQRHAKAFQVVDPLCRLLITTRQGGIVTQLNAQGERLQTLSEAEGLRLIAGRVGAEVADLPAECAEIIKLVDGHTLAVSLAAAQLDERGLDYAPNLLKRMQKGRTFDDKTLSLAPDDKNLNLELCLRLSYDDLNADLQRRFRALGVLTIEGTFDADLAKALWDDEDDFDTDDALTALTRFGLIRRDEDATDERYAQHGLLRAYAGALLDAAEEREAAFGRYADYVTTLAEAFIDLPPQDWKQLDDDLPHILHIGDTFIAIYEEQAIWHELALQFAVNTANYVYRRPEAHRLRWLEMGLDLSRQLETQRQEGLFLNELGLYHRVRGNNEQALSYYKRALPICRELEDRSDEATTLNNIGLVYSEHGDNERALVYHEQALSIVREIGYRSGEAATLNSIGLVYSEYGDRERALVYYEQALPINREVGNRAGEATTLVNIGAVCHAQGKYRRALSYFERALPIHRDVGNRSDEATTLNNIGMVYDAQGDYKQALAYYEQSLAISREIGDISGEATTLNNTGLVYHAQSDNERALFYYEQSLPIVREIGYRSGEARTLQNIAGIYYAQGDNERALSYYEQSLAINRDVGNRSGEATTCYNIGLAYYDQGNLDAAIDYIQRCVELDELIGHPDLESDRQFLIRLKRERAAQGDGSPDDA